MTTATFTPQIPESAPFDAEQRAWINGYLAALFPGTLPTTTSAPQAALEPLLIMYGSQTGSAESLAKSLGKEASARGFDARVIELNNHTSVDLTKEIRLAIITSTWGDGDPPDNAVAFWEHLSSEAAPKLDHLNYSVLALGDSNYAEFCGAGKKFDERIEALGGKRIHPRVDCDVDYEDPAEEWKNGFWSAIEKTKTGEASSNGHVAGSALVEMEAAVETGYSKKNPFPARLITNLKLNGEGSAKDTRHFEISLEGSGLEYEVGDALGTIPTNCPEVVDDLLTALGFDGEEAVPDPKGNETSIRHALLHNYQVTQPQKKFLEAVVERCPDSELSDLLKPKQKSDLEKYLWGREVIDLVLENSSLALKPSEFVSFLGKLQPRLYSISSSPKAHPGEVHLTVAVVRHESHGRTRKGVCSTFLAERVEASTPVPVFIQTSHGFRLPTDGDVPIIMVGPGTGIAPFRAFIEERQMTDAKGKNWIFFGDQCAETDFLYKDQLQNLKNDGILTRLDTAFSRDQAEKIYVQNRMIENAGELWKWLDEGAYFYVCGDAKRMAKDVDAALHKIVEKVGGKTPEQAVEYINQMKTEKRYARDVY